MALKEQKQKVLLKKEEKTKDLQSRREETEIEKYLGKIHIDKPKKKDGRGRPKGSKKKAKPTYTKQKYTDHPVAGIINRATCGIINKTALKNAEKLKPEEIELGEAVVYTMEYYADWLDHPVMIIIGAGIGLGITVYDKSKKKTTKTEEHKLEQEWDIDQNRGFKE